MIHIRLIVGILYVIILMILMALAGCQHEPLVPGLPDKKDGEEPMLSSCDPNTVYFQNDVLPILISNCTMSGCHDENTAEDGVILTNYAHIMNSSVVDPFDSDGSDIYEVITEDDSDKIMPRPPANPLTSDQIAIIKAWIDQGALNNSCANTNCETENVTFELNIKPIFEDKCQGCHSSSSPAGGRDFSTYSGIKNAVVDSRLVGAINHEPGFFAMPQGGSKLPQCEIDMITKWIQEGSLEN